MAVAHALADQRRAAAATAVAAILWLWHEGLAGTEADGPVGRRRVSPTLPLMFTIRNAGGVALLLFGSTLLWLTPEFATPGVDTTGAWWAATRVLALVTVAGFTIATWGLFRRHPWWENAALASAGAGVLVLVPYWIAARAAGEVNPGFNVVIHLLGAAGVVLFLLVPRLQIWVRRHVTAGR